MGGRQPKKRRLSPYKRKNAFKTPHSVSNLNRVVYVCVGAKRVWLCAKGARSSPNTGVDDGMGRVEHASGEENRIHRLQVHPPLGRVLACACAPKESFRPRRSIDSDPLCVCVCVYKCRCVFILSKWQKIDATTKSHPGSWKVLIFLCQPWGLMWFFSGRFYAPPGVCRCVCAVWWGS